MSAINYITNSKIPFNEAFLMPKRFVLLNMASGGVWYVDTEHPEWEKIKQTALDTARTFGDIEEIKRLEELP